jgi:hypothetical protein
MSRADYLAHSTFQDILYVNAYLHWQMPPEVTRLIVSGPDWIARLGAEVRRRVLERQVALRRGLVFPRDSFATLPDALEAFVVGNDVVLCHAAWDALPDDLRRQVLLREQARWDDVACFPAPDDAPEHIRAIANTFGQPDGANCLSTTAYCVTGQAWLRDLWLFQPAFRDLIARHGYLPAPDCSPCPDDVVTFEVEDVIIHAAYCLGDDRFINKNGQSRFNPIRIVDWAMLRAGWPEAAVVTHRRQPALVADADP